MKKTVLALCIAASTLAACNNESDAKKDAVQKADSTNEVKQDATPAAIKTDDETTEFLTKAANGGMAEVDAGKLADTKALSADVKRFAMMMVMDHTKANAEVKALAAARNVTLPAMVSDDKKKTADDLAAKSGSAFDKAYMDQMIKDHKETINLFEKGADDSKDAEVKTFINNTLPKLKMHLDSAQMIYKMVK